MSGRMIVILRTITQIKKVGELEAVTKKLPVAVREVEGNLRFPLDFTYHGCPRIPYGVFCSQKLTFQDLTPSLLVAA